MTASPHTVLIFQDHLFPVSAVAWSPDGTKLASASAEKTQIWDSTTGQVLLTLRGHIQPITDVAWSPDGTKLATSGYDSAVIVWDAANGQSVSAYIIQGSINPDEDRPPIFAIAWNGNGNRIAAASLDSAVRILDANDLQLLATLKKHTDSAVSVTWSPDGLFIASGSVDGTIRVWNVVNEETIKVLQVNTDVSSLDWSPDSSQIAYRSDDEIMHMVSLADILTPTTAAPP